MDLSYKLLEGQAIFFSILALVIGVYQLARMPAIGMPPLKDYLAPISMVISVSAFIMTMLAGSTVISNIDYQQARFNSEKLVDTKSLYHTFFELKTKMERDADFDIPRHADLNPLLKTQSESTHSQVERILFHLQSCEHKLVPQKGCIADLNNLVSYLRGL